MASGLHFQNDFQLDRRTEWEARDAKDETRGDDLFANDISRQFRRRIRDLRVFGELAVAAMFMPMAKRGRQREEMVPTTLLARFW